MDFPQESIRDRSALSEVDGIEKSVADEIYTILDTPKYIES